MNYREQIVKAVENDRLDPKIMFYELIAAISKKDLKEMVEENDVVLDILMEFEEE
jgi:hypothetical protein